MKQREKILETLEQRLGGVEPPSAADVKCYVDWLYEQLAVASFLKWLRAERPEGYKELTEGLISNRNDKAGRQKVISDIQGGYSSEFLATEPPMGKLDPALHNWETFIRDNPDLEGKAEPSFEEIMAVLKEYGGKKYE